MSANPNYEPPDDATFEETLQVDEATSDARSLTSNQFAAFRAIFAYVVELANKVEVMDECAVKSAADACMTIIDAARQADYRRSIERRFKCPGWQLELYRRRAKFPEGLSEDAAKQLRSTLSKQFRRAAWSPLHALLCRSQIPLFKKERGGDLLKDEKGQPLAKGKEKRRQPSWYTDRMTDLINATMQRATMRGAGALRGRRVDKFDMAAREVVDRFAKAKGKYAPDWTPEIDSKAAQSASGGDRHEQTPLERAESLTKAAAGRVAAIARELSAEESRALGLGFIQWANEVWEKATGESLPVFSPVEEWRDMAAEAAPLSDADLPLDSDEVCENASKNEDSAESIGTFLSLLETVEPEPRGQSLPEAQAALDAFESVGVRLCTVAIIDDTKPYEESLVDSSLLPVVELRQSLPGLLAVNLANETQSICVRVAGKKREYSSRRLVQYDDVPAEVLPRLSPFAFLIEATSPNNYQAWLALSDLIPDHDDFVAMKRRLYAPLKSFGVNGGAHGSVRWAGTLNRKPKRRYADGESPRIQLIQTAPGRITSLAELEAAGLLAPAPPKSTPEEVRAIKARLPEHGASYDYAQAKQDRSGADWKFVCAELRQGFPAHLVVSHLEATSEKAAKRSDGYATVTVEKARRELGLI